MILRPPKVEPALPEWPEPVQGAKYLRILHKHVLALRGKATPDPHGNRDLFLDDVVLAHLYAFFNPTIKSLRVIEDFSKTRQSKKHIKAPKIARSTLSDFHKVVDPTLLQPIIAHLHSEARKKNCLPGGLPETVMLLLLVDGSYFAVAANVAWAVHHATNNGKKKASVRADFHINAATWLPEIIDVHGADISEADSAAMHIKPGAVHVYDRGIFSFELVQAQHDAKAFFVHRLCKPGPRTPKLEIVEERPLTDAQRHAGVLADRLVRFTGSRNREAPDIVLREVILTSPGEADGEIRLLTNLTHRADNGAGIADETLDAATVGLLYRYRWQVELFFRWLKVFAHFEHMISHSANGVLLSFYVAVIGVLLICLFTNTRPSKYAYIMLSWVANGNATLEEIAPILAERHRQIAVENAGKARRAEKKKNG
jgi:hypothetical protein